MSATFTILFLILMTLGVPIALVLALAPIVGFMLADKWTFLNIVPQKLVGGINQFPLLAIPLFILSGEVMNAGGVTSRLVAVARTFVGHFRGDRRKISDAFIEAGKSLGLTERTDFNRGHEDQHRDPELADRLPARRVPGANVRGRFPA